MTQKLPDIDADVDVLMLVLLGVLLLNFDVSQA